MTIEKTAPYYTLADDRLPNFVPFNAAWSDALAVYQQKDNTSNVVNKNDTFPEAKNRNSKAASSDGPPDWPPKGYHQYPVNGLDLGIPKENVAVSNDGKRILFTAHVDITRSMHKYIKSKVQKFNYDYELEYNKKGATDIAFRKYDRFSIEIKPQAETITISGPIVVQKNIDGSRRSGVGHASSRAQIPAVQPLTPRWDPREIISINPLPKDDGALSKIVQGAEYIAKQAEGFGEGIVEGVEEIVVGTLGTINSAAKYATDTTIGLAVTAGGNILENVSGKKVKIPEYLPNSERGAQATSFLLETGAGIGKWLYNGLGRYVADPALAGYNAITQGNVTLPPWAPDGSVSDKQTASVARAVADPVVKHFKAGEIGKGIGRGVAEIASFITPEVWGAKFAKAAAIVPGLTIKSLKVAEGTRAAEAANAGEKLVIASDADKIATKAAEGADLVKAAGRAGRDLPVIHIKKSDLRFVQEGKSETFEILVTVNGEEHSLGIIGRSIKDASFDMTLESGIYANNSKTYTGIVKIEDSSLTSEAILYLKEKQRAKTLSGTLRSDNYVNFEKEVMNIIKKDPTRVSEMGAVYVEAVKGISYGRHRVDAGYRNIWLEPKENALNTYKDIKVMLDNGTEIYVPMPEHPNFFAELEK